MDAPSSLPAGLCWIGFFDIGKLYNTDGSLKKSHELDDDATAALFGVDITEISGGETLPW